MKPSIEIASKMAQLLDVSQDWLTGHKDLEIDKKMIQRIQEVTKMNPNDKQHVFALLDAFIKQTKINTVLRKKNLRSRTGDFAFSICYSLFIYPGTFKPPALILLFFLPPFLIVRLFGSFLHFFFIIK